ncbi:MAG: YdcF family protein [Clostridia bacterium]|nr:YdcF family protein [Clostridia bacterium]
MIPWIYMVIGGIFICNFFVMIFVSNLNVGLVGSFLIGCYLFVWGIWIQHSPKGDFTRKWNWIHRTFLVGVSVLLGISLFLGVYGNHDTVDYDEDALVVLGAAVHGETVSLPLKYRLDTAIEYAGKNPDAVIVVSGGQGPQEAVTEAYAMEQYLLRHGVSNLIVKEEQATSTYENFLYSKKLLDERLGSNYRVAFVTNDFHIYRSHQTAKRAGFETAAFLHGKTAWYNLVHNYLRESLAVIKLWVLGT